jgi:hypothetical protein
MANPNMEHWMAVKRIFRYLQGTLQMKLQFGGTPSKEFLDIAMRSGVVIL